MLYVRKIVSSLLVVVLSIQWVLPMELAYAQLAPGLLALPGITPPYNPVLIKGMTIDPANPFVFDFIVDSGDENILGHELETESMKLVKYFLASLTTPENELWVNLNPAEADRIVPQSFGETEMGRDLLAQDYLLKQLSASFLSPDNEFGKKFWDELRRQSGTDVPIDLAHKIWIVPEHSEIYVNGNTVVVVDSHLKVMLESEYKAIGKAAATDTVQTDTIRQTILPMIEKEVNDGKTFANLRQIFNSLILAVWYKKHLKESIITQHYANQHKIDGLGYQKEDGREKREEQPKSSFSPLPSSSLTPEDIYNQYLTAFKQGVYDIIKEEYDPTKQHVVSTKYFTGGVDAAMIYQTIAPALPAPRVLRQFQEPYNVRVELSRSPDAAMKAGSESDKLVDDNVMLPHRRKEWGTLLHQLATGESPDVEAFNEKNWVIITTPFGSISVTTALNHSILFRHLGASTRYQLRLEKELGKAAQVVFTNNEETITYILEGYEYDSLRKQGKIFPAHRVGYIHRDDVHSQLGTLLHGLLIGRPADVTGFNDKNWIVVSTPSGNISVTGAIRHSIGFPGLSESTQYQLRVEKNVKEAPLVIFTNDRETITYKVDQYEYNPAREKSKSFDAHKVFPDSANDQLGKVLHELLTGRPADVTGFNNKNWTIVSTPSANISITGAMYHRIQFLNLSPSTQYQIRVEEEQGQAPQVVFTNGKKSVIYEVNKYDYNPTEVDPKIFHAHKMPPDPDAAMVTFADKELDSFQTILKAGVFRTFLRPDMVDPNLGWIEDYQRSHQNILKYEINTKVQEDVVSFFEEDIKDGPVNILDGLTGESVDREDAKTYTRVTTVSYTDGSYIAIVYNDPYAVFAGVLRKALDKYLSKSNVDQTQKKIIVKEFDSDDPLIKIVSEQFIETFFGRNTPELNGVKITKEQFWLIFELSPGANKNITEAVRDVLSWLDANYPDVAMTAEYLPVVGSVERMDEVLSKAALVDFKDVIQREEGIQSIYLGVNDPQLIATIMQARRIPSQFTMNDWGWEPGPAAQRAASYVGRAGIVFELAGENLEKFYGIKSDIEMFLYKSAWLYHIKRAWIVLNDSPADYTNGKMRVVEVVIPGMASALPMMVKTAYLLHPFLREVTYETNLQENRLRWIFSPEARDSLSADASFDSIPESLGDVLVSFQNFVTQLEINTTDNDDKELSMDKEDAGLYLKELNEIRESFHHEINRLRSLEELDAVRRNLLLTDSGPLQQMLSVSLEIKKFLEFKVQDRAMAAKVSLATVQQFFKKQDAAMLGFGWLRKKFKERQEAKEDYARIKDSLKSFTKVTKDLKQLMEARKAVQPQYQSITLDQKNLERFQGWLARLDNKRLKNLYGIALGTPSTLEMLKKLPEGASAEQFLETVFNASEAKLVSQALKAVNEQLQADQEQVLADAINPREITEMIIQEVAWRVLEGRYSASSEGRDPLRSKEDTTSYESRVLTMQLIDNDGRKLLKYKTPSLLRRIQAVWDRPEIRKNEAVVGSIYTIMQRFAMVPADLQRLPRGDFFINNEGRLYWNKFRYPQPDAYHISDIEIITQGPSQGVYEVELERISRTKPKQGKGIIDLDSLEANIEALGQDIDAGDTVVNRKPADMTVIKNIVLLLRRDLIIKEYLPEPEINLNRNWNPVGKKALQKYSYFLRAHYGLDKAVELDRAMAAQKKMVPMRKFFDDSNGAAGPAIPFNGLIVGQEVYHEKRGLGKIVSKEDEKVWVQFANGRGDYGRISFEGVLKTFSKPVDQKAPSVGTKNVRGKNNNRDAAMITVPFADEGLRQRVRDVMYIQTKKAYPLGTRVIEAQAVLGALHGSFTDIENLTVYSKLPEIYAGEQGIDIYSMDNPNSNLVNSDSLLEQMELHPSDLYVIDSLTGSNVYEMVSILKQDEYKEKFASSVFYFFSSAERGSYVFDFNDDLRLLEPHKKVLTETVSLPQRLRVNLENAGFTPKSGPVFSSNRLQAQGHAILERALGHRLDRPVIAINMHAIYFNSKKYDFSKIWLKLMVLLAHKKDWVDVVFLSGSVQEQDDDGRQQTQEMVKELKERGIEIPVLPPLNVEQLKSVLSTISGFVSVQTGPAHFAGALGIPTVVVALDKFGDSYLEEDDRVRIVETGDPLLLTDESSSQIVDEIENNLIGYGFFEPRIEKAAPMITSAQFAEVMAGPPAPAVYFKGFSPALAVGEQAVKQAEAISASGDRAMVASTEVIRTALFSDEEKATFRERFPQWDLELALQVPWSETVRDEIAQPAPVDAYEENYFSNQAELRGETLKLLLKMAQKPGIDEDEFAEELSRLNEITMRDYGPGEMRNYAPDQLKRIAGFYTDKLRMRGVHHKTIPLKTLLEDFIKQHDRPTSYKEALNTITEFYWVMIWPFNRYAGEKKLDYFLFKRSNNSMFRNMIYGMLRLIGLQGFSHGYKDKDFWDFTKMGDFKQKLMDDVVVANPWLKERLDEPINSYDTNTDDLSEPVLAGAVDRQSRSLPDDAMAGDVEISETDLAMMVNNFLNGEVMDFYQNNHRVRLFPLKKKSLLFYFYPRGITPPENLAQARSKGLPYIDKGKRMYEWRADDRGIPYIYINSKSKSAVIQSHGGTAVDGTWSVAPHVIGWPKRIIPISYYLKALSEQGINRVLLVACNPHQAGVAVPAGMELTYSMTMVYGGLDSSGEWRVLKAGTNKDGIIEGSVEQPGDIISKMARLIIKIKKKLSLKIPYYEEPVEYFWKEESVASTDVAMTASGEDGSDRETWMDPTDISDGEPPSAHATAWWRMMTALKKGGGGIITLSSSEENIENFLAVSEQPKAKEPVSLLNHSSGKFQTIEMKVSLSEEEIVAIGRRYEGSSKVPGRSPMGGRYNPGRVDKYVDFVTKELPQLIVPSAERHISVPAEFAGAKILFIGPGHDADQVLWLLKRFPNIGEMHIIDAFAVERFQEYDEQITNYLAMHPEVKTRFYGYAASVLELPDQLKGQIDLVIDMDVLDKGWFSPDQNKQVAGQLTNVLKEGGLHVSLGMFRFQSYEKDGPMIVVPVKDGNLLFDKNVYSKMRQADLRKGPVIGESDPDASMTGDELDKMKKRISFMLQAHLQPWLDKNDFTSSFTVDNTPDGIWTVIIFTSQLGEKKEIRINEAIRDEARDELNNLLPELQQEFKGYKTELKDHPLNKTQLLLIFTPDRAMAAEASGGESFKSKEVNALEEMVRNKAPLSQIISTAQAALEIQDKRVNQIFRDTLAPGKVYGVPPGPGSYILHAINTMVSIEEELKKADLSKNEESEYWYYLLGYRQGLETALQKVLEHNLVKNFPKRQQALTAADGPIYQAINILKCMEEALHPARDQKNVNGPAAATGVDNIIAGIDSKLANSIVDPKNQRNVYAAFFSNGRHASSNLILSISSQVPQYRQKVINQIIKILRGNEVILSVGEGQGHLAADLQQQHLNVYAVDINEQFTQLAHEKGVRQVVANALYLPYADSTFDVLIFNESIGAMNIEAVFKEAFRVLKADGRVFIINVDQIAQEIERSKERNFLSYSDKEIRETAIHSGFKAIKRDTLFSGDVISISFYEIQKSDAAMISNLQWPETNVENRTPEFDQRMTEVFIPGLSKTLRAIAPGRLTAVHLDSNLLRELFQQIEVLAADLNMKDEIVQFIQNHPYTMPEEDFYQLFFKLNKELVKRGWIIRAGIEERIADIKWAKVQGYTVITDPDGQEVMIVVTADDKNLPIWGEPMLGQSLASSDPGGYILGRAELHNEQRLKRDYRMLLEGPKHLGNSPAGVLISKLQSVNEKDYIKIVKHFVLVEEFTHYQDQRRVDQARRKNPQLPLSKAIEIILAAEPSTPLINVIRQMWIAYTKDLERQNFKEFDPRLFLDATLELRAFFQTTLHTANATEFIVEMAQRIKALTTSQVGSSDYWLYKIPLQYIFWGVGQGLKGQGADVANPRGPLNPNTYAFLTDPQLRKKIEAMMRPQQAPLGGSSLNQAATLPKNPFSNKRIEDDRAMVTKAPGGIDLNPQKWEVEESGNKIDFNLPTTNLSQDIPALYPVIINITPITNLPQLLGIVPRETPKEAELSQL